MIHGTDLSFGPTTTKFFRESSETSGCLALYAATARQRAPGSADSIQAAITLSLGLRSGDVVMCRVACLIMHDYASYES